MGRWERGFNINVCCLKYVKYFLLMRLLCARVTNEMKKICDKWDFVRLRTRWVWHQLDIIKSSYTQEPSSERRACHHVQHLYISLLLLTFFLTWSCVTSVLGYWGIILNLSYQLSPSQHVDERMWSMSTRLYLYRCDEFSVSHCSIFSFVQKYVKKRAFWIH